MEIKTTKEIQNRIGKYISRSDLNNMIAYKLSLPISVNQSVFNNPLKLETCASEMQVCFRQQGINYTKEQSIIAMMINCILEGQGGLESFPAPIIHEIIINGKVLHKNDMMQNPYLKNIQIKEITNHNVKLENTTFHKYEMFNYNEGIQKFNGVILPSIGTIDHRLQFPMIKENNQTWMSI